MIIHGIYYQKEDFCFYPAFFEDKEDCFIEFNSIIGKQKFRPDKVLSVGCFCECYDLEKMWQDYASYEGICIGIKDDYFLINLQKQLKLMK